MLRNCTILKFFKVLRYACASYSPYPITTCIFFASKDEQKEELLEGLLDCSISFNEAEKESERLKMLSASKEAFIKEVELGTWAEAQIQIPQFAKLDLLQKFKVLKGKPLPKSFKVCATLLVTHTCIGGIGDSESYN